MLALILSPEYIKLFPILEPLLLLLWFIFFPQLFVWLFLFICAVSTQMSHLIFNTTSSKILLLNISAKVTPSFYASKLQKHMKLNNSMFLCAYFLPPDTKVQAPWGTYVFISLEPCTTHVYELTDRQNSKVIIYNMIHFFCSFMITKGSGSLEILLVVPYYLSF